MPNRRSPSSYFKDAATLEAKRQRQATERQQRYLNREKQKATALLRKKRRVRLALEGYVDVFNLLSREDLSTLEITYSRFHSIVTTHLTSVCLIAVNVARVELELTGCIVVDGLAKFRAIDESHTGPAPNWQKQFHENVYVLLQRVASKCLIKTLVLNYLKNLDDVACKALIAIQPNVSAATFDSKCRGAIEYNVALDVVQSALFGFSSVDFPLFCAPYEVFTGHAVKHVKDCELGKVDLYAPSDRSRYHDDDLIALFSLSSGKRESMLILKGLRLSSEFFTKVIEVDEQNRGTHHFDDTAGPYQNSSVCILEQQNLPRLHFNIVDLDYGEIKITRASF